jgi:hypothetical protein
LTNEERAFGSANLAELTQRIVRLVGFQRNDPLGKGRGQMQALVGVRSTAGAKRAIIAVCCAQAAGRKQVLH